MSIVDVVVVVACDESGVFSGERRFVECPRLAPSLLKTAHHRVLDVHI